MQTEVEDQFVDELIERMDTNVDGKIDFQEFVQFIRCHVTTLLLLMD